VPLGGRCGETMELEGREPTIATPPCLSRHPNRIHEKEGFWFEKCMNRVRRYATTPRWWATQLLRSTTSRAIRAGPNVGTIRERIFFVWCSSPFTEAVPPGRDRSIRGVPPSVNGLVHSRSVHTLLMHCMHICARMYAHLAGHIQLNSISATKFTSSKYRNSPSIS